MGGDWQRYAALVRSADQLLGEAVRLQGQARDDGEAHRFGAETFGGGARRLRQLHLRLAELRASLQVTEPPPLPNLVDIVPVMCREVQEALDPAVTLAEHGPAGCAPRCWSSRYVDSERAGVLDRHQANQSVGRAPCTATPVVTSLSDVEVRQDTEFHGAECRTSDSDSFSDSDSIAGSEDRRVASGSPLRMHQRSDKPRSAGSAGNEQLQCWTCDRWYDSAHKLHQHLLGQQHSRRLATLVHQQCWRDRVHAWDK